MATPLVAAKGAALIEAKTGRRCTRQNLEKLCERGALHGSRCVMQVKPLRVDGDLLVAEYLKRVAPHQAEAIQPRATQRDQEPMAVVPRQMPRPATGDGEELPEYTVSRARSEHEKANLLELERRTKEGELVYRADFVTAQNAVAAQIMNRAEALPRQIKQAIPHLLVEEVEKIERLIKEMMEAVANWSYEDVEE